MENYISIIEKLRCNEVKLTMPKFEIYFSAELKPYFNSLGINDAFSESADFEGMMKKDVNIALILHKTFIKVNEKGTEAAAVTIVEIMKGKGCKRKKNYEMIVHPFLFVIIGHKLPLGHDILFASKIEYI